MAHERSADSWAQEDEPAQAARERELAEGQREVAESERLRAAEDDPCRLAARASDGDHRQAIPGT